MSANDPKRTSDSISCCGSEASFSPYQSIRLSRYDDHPEPESRHEAAGISRCHRRCSSVAVCRARAAGRACTPPRHPYGHRRRRSGTSGSHRGTQAWAGAGGLDRGPQSADRCALGRRCRQPSKECRGDGRACAGRDLVLRHSKLGAVAAGDPHPADCVCERRRSGRCRLRRKLAATGWQRHRLHAVRI